MVSQFYNGITTNLITGRCTIPLSNGITAVVNDCIELDLELRGTDGGAKKEASYQSDDVEKLKSILKRVYLTLFPIPIDSGWCDCGMIHGEENGME
ncbi:hypothetical protein ADEAN_000231400 [Angomonas deanei]|uniref:Uncharacterized protein n=1 Tax=Angomonas deanei TaxID=59799 RepID=A0A7G2C747_9TRYP|nr:hypothetical protein ADEAN_000231400 [Angomonas deanei]